jgi:hypothetical protein
MRRHDYQREVTSIKRFFERSRPANILREPYIGKVERVSTFGLNPTGYLGLASPQRDLMAVARRYKGERGAPASRPDDRYSLAEGSGHQL